MKKLLMTIVLLSLSVASTFAESQETNAVTTKTETNITTEAAVDTSLITHDSIPVSVDNEYIFYHGDGCPACAQVKQYFKSTNAEEKYKIDSREVWKSRENAALMSMDIKKLGLDPSSIWVPFFIVKNGDKVSYISGSNKVIEHFYPTLGEYVAPKRNSLAIIIVGLLLIILPIAFMSFGSKNK